MLDIKRQLLCKKVCLFLMVTNYSFTLNSLECENELINTFTRVLFYYLLCLLDWLITLGSELSMKSMKAVLWLYMVCCAHGIFVTKLFWRSSFLWFAPWRWCIEFCALYVGSIYCLLQKQVRVFFMNLNMFPMPSLN